MNITKKVKGERMDYQDDKRDLNDVIVKNVCIYIFSRL